MSSFSGGPPLNNTQVFISASIPDLKRWEGRFDALAITDAVVAIARTVLAGGGRLVTAAHPTIAPLLLYVAAEQPTAPQPAVVVYQSEVFEPVWPAATRRFEEQEIGTVIRTPAVGDEPPDPRAAPKSLQLMRERLLAEQPLAAAIFVGGMRGITVEYEMFTARHPDAPTYALGGPGGEAATLIQHSPAPIRALLGASDVYPQVAREIVADLVAASRG